MPLCASSRCLFLNRRRSLGPGPAAVGAGAAACSIGLFGSSPTGTDTGAAVGSLCLLIVSLCVADDVACLARGMGRVPWGLGAWDGSSSAACSAASGRSCAAADAAACSAAADAVSGSGGAGSSSSSDGGSGGSEGVSAPVCPSTSWLPFALPTASPFTGTPPPDGSVPA